eukprot:snap_masked-scaffold_62-processed-gene-0.52-mRNA-1 protein AED:1.00 eAED:1.00 QI:0/0/0/0/1/1/2/0/494
MTDLQKAYSRCTKLANSDEAKDFVSKLKCENTNLQELLDDLVQGKLYLFNPLKNADYLSRKEEQQLIRWCVFFMLFHRRCFPKDAGTYRETPFFTVFENLGNPSNQYIPEQAKNKKQRLVFDYVVRKLSEVDTEEILIGAGENEYTLADSKSIWGIINILPKYCLFSRCNVEDMISWGGNEVPFLKGLSGNLIKMRNDKIDKFIFLFLYDMCARKKGEFLAIMVLYFIQKEVEKENEDLRSFLLDCFYVLKNKYSGAEVKGLNRIVIAQEAVTKTHGTPVLQNTEGYSFRNTNKTGTGTSVVEEVRNPFHSSLGVVSTKSKGQSFPLLINFFDECNEETGFESIVLAAYVNNKKEGFAQVDIKNHSEKLGKPYGLSEEDVRKYSMVKPKEDPGYVYTKEQVEHVSTNGDNDEVRHGVGLKKDELSKPKEKDNLLDVKKKTGKEAKKKKTGKQAKKKKTGMVRRAKNAVTKAINSRKKTMKQNTKGDDGSPDPTI